MATELKGKWDAPQEVDRATLAFPAVIGHLLPGYAEVPEEFKGWRGNEYVDAVDSWFFKGMAKADWKAKPGIDAEKAWRHLSACMGSFAPKHEHKIAGVAYLMSLWFEKAQVTP
jgi:hypothetical protein